MSKKVCKAHRRKDCSTCKTTSASRGYDAMSDAAMWTTVYGSSYDSGSCDSASSSSCSD